MRAITATTKDTAMQLLWYFMQLLGEEVKVGWGGVEGRQGITIATAVAQGRTWETGREGSRTGRGLWAS